MVKHETATEVLPVIHEFIATTGSLSARQLYLLELTKPLVSKELYAEHDKHIEQEIARNVTLLSDICAGLQRNGIDIKVTHPESGEVASLAGIAYSTEATSYQAGVMGRKHELEVWPLLSGVQLSI